MASAAVAALLLGGAAACRGDEVGPPAQTDLPAAADAEQGLTYCDNLEYGFRVAYPSDWQTNAGDVLPSCTVFHPGEIEIPVASELPHDLAITISREPVELEELTRDDAWHSIVFAERVAVAGLPAVRMEYEATGEGLRDAGALTYRYVVQLEAGVLIAATHDVGTPSYQEKRAVLDRMIETLQLTGPRFAAGLQSRRSAPAGSTLLARRAGT
jgi:hypothetical protein